MFNNFKFKDFTLINGKIKLHRYKSTLITNNNIVKTSFEPGNPEQWVNEPLEIPLEYERYDNEPFSGILSDALLYINENNIYTVKQDKEKLNRTDYLSIKYTAQVLLQLLENPEISRLVSDELLDKFRSNEFLKQDWRDEINRLEVK